MIPLDSTLVIGLSFNIITREDNNNLREDQQSRVVKTSMNEVSIVLDKIVNSIKWCRTKIMALKGPTRPNLKYNILPI